MTLAFQPAVMVPVAHLRLAMGRVEAIEQRHDPRKGFLKRALIVLDGGGVVDCVVENLSATGARLRLGNPRPLPEAFALRFHDGTSYAARRCWSRGTAVGVAFEGGGPAAEAERRHTAGAVRGASLAADPAAVLAPLRGALFFGDERLRRAAAELELAQARFAGALAPHMGPPNSGGAPVVERACRRPNALALAHPRGSKYRWRSRKVRCPPCGGTGHYR
jgi:hypothetical protein